MNEQTIYTVGQSYEFTSLDYETVYNVTLQSDCQDSYHGLSLISEPLIFTTLSAPVDIPYYQNFDTITTLPNEFVANGSVSLSSTHYGDSGQSLQLSSTQSSNSMVTIPQLNYFSDELQFQAEVCSTTQNTQYSIGLMSDPYDLATFTPIYDGVITVPNTWSNVQFTTCTAYICRSNW